MRKYNEEIIDNESRKYAYDFDLDVIHPFMVRAFKPFFVEGDALELGCFQGAFSSRVVDYFTELTCVDASQDAIAKAEKLLCGKNVKFFEGTFEEIILPRKYNNIFLTHVLEHVDDRVGLLAKINREWLSEDGVLFVACPNGNAPSRQIAVKMGLIDTNISVTPAEWKHGHRITYTFDTLEGDIRKAGLKIVFKSGIFFKALANFQWDQVIAQGIVSNDYLEGCYSLGQQYPELCSSIYFVCRRSE